MRKLLILFILCFPGSILFAQGGGDVLRQVLLDSVKAAYGISTSDAQKAELNMRLSELYVAFEPDSSIFYGEKGLILARNTGEFETEIGILGFLAGALIYKGDYPKALELCLEADRIRIKNLPPGSNEALGIGPAYINLLLIFEHIGEYEKALYYANKMSDYPISDIITVAYGNYYVARIHEKMNNIDSALHSLNISLAQFNSLENSLKGFYGVHPELYNLRAYIYLKQGETTLALQDFNTSLELSRRTGFVPYTSNTLIDLSNYYQSVNQSDSVIYYAKRALEEAQTISYTKGILNASEILSKAYDSKDLAKAFYYYKIATETRNSLFGAGNIQLIRDMISQNEQKKEDLLKAKETYQNKLKLYFSFAGLAALLVITLIFYRNNKKTKASNLVLANTLDNLKSTQAQLIQTEKMASLGELTAGIAHEIQNPLNFVNNFSEVNKELLVELKDEIKKGHLDEVNAIADDVISNEEKIYHHGKRADAIVKGMLQHSQSGSGVKEPTDINALADEYLRLAYHGLKAKDKSFSATLKTDFQSGIGKIYVIPQDIGRVLLNLINNAFYAVNERSKEQVIGYEPAVSVCTKKANDELEIRVADNGNGIPEKVLDKVFQPFFTTKPTGQGTGLGLSLSYDIVKAHQGKINIRSTPGAGAEFIITLPINA